MTGCRGGERYSTDDATYFDFVFAFAEPIATPAHDLTSQRSTCKSSRLGRPSKVNARVRVEQMRPEGQRRRGRGRGRVVPRGEARVFGKGWSSCSQRASEFAAAKIGVHVSKRIDLQDVMECRAKLRFLSSCHGEVVGTFAYSECRKYDHQLTAR